MKRQRGQLVSIRSARRFLRERDLRVKTDYIRDIFLSLKMVKDYEGDDGMRERYRIPDLLSKAHLSLTLTE